MLHIFGRLKKIFQEKIHHVSKIAIGYLGKLAREFEF